MESYRKTRVWDLPTRLFHWALVILVVFSFVSGNIGGNLVPWHYRSGYAILTLLLFRIVWGFVGSRHARFSSFIPAPGRILSYLRGIGRRDGEHTAGHNPLGAVSAYAMLLSLLFQVSTGLFANDDIVDQGPLAIWISKELSDRLTDLHKINRIILVVLIVGHLAAMLFYYFYKHVNLVKPMLSGDMQLKVTGDALQANDDVAANDSGRMRLLALVILAACAALVYALVTSQPASLA